MNWKMCEECRKPVNSDNMIYLTKGLESGPDTGYYCKPCAGKLGFFISKDKEDE